MPPIVLKVDAIMGGSVGCLQKKIEEMRGKKRRRNRSEMLIEKK